MFYLRSHERFAENFAEKIHKLKKYTILIYLAFRNFRPLWTPLLDISDISTVNRLYHH